MRAFLESQGLAFSFRSRQIGCMHPPDFNPNHRLSDWPDCFVEAGCPQCGKTTVVSVRMLKGGGDALLVGIAGRLRCAACGVPAAPVYLLAGRTRSFMGGPRPDWSIELVAGRKCE